MPGESNDSRRAHARWAQLQYDDVARGKFRAVRVRFGNH
jgi:hypothetical protein